eukprot:5087699-Heterocapsa_arctica.AAC.1
MGAVPHGCTPSHVAVGRANVHSTSCRACRRRPARCFTRLSIDLQVFTSISAASPQCSMSSSFYFCPHMSISYSTYITWSSIWSS